MTGRARDWPDDLYERLGAARGASATEIRRRYLELVGRYHPDRHQGNPLGDLARERLVAINAAYEVLSDPATRAAYDARFVSAPATHARAAAAPPSYFGRAIVGFLLVAAVGLLALRLVPAVGRVLTTVAGTGAGAFFLALLLAAGAVVVIVRARARRRK